MKSSNKIWILILSKNFRQSPKFKKKIIIENQKGLEKIKQKKVTLSISSPSNEVNNPAPILNKKHNILFISIDDFRPKINSYGESQMITPNLDKLASEGVQFNQAYVNIAVCGASSASILTGIRGSTNRFYHYYAKAETDVPNVVTLPQILRENGYKRMYQYLVLKFT